MTARMENTTAMLAMVFGMSLFTANAVGEATAKVDARTARELAVMSRILEKRLGETRQSLAAAVLSSPPARPRECGS